MWASEQVNGWACAGARARAFARFVLCVFATTAIQRSFFTPTFTKSIVCNRLMARSLSISLLIPVVLVPFSHTIHFTNPTKFGTCLQRRWILFIFRFFRTLVTLFQTNKLLDFGRCSPFPGGFFTLFQLFFHVLPQPSNCFDEVLSHNEWHQYSIDS